jgi:hypothetical protein
MTKTFNSKEQFDLAGIMGNTELTEAEIQEACEAAQTAKQAAKQAVMTKLGLTADEVKALLS